MRTGEDRGRDYSNISVVIQGSTPPNIVPKKKRASSPQARRQQQQRNILLGQNIKSPDSTRTTTSPNNGCSKQHRLRSNMKSATSNAGVRVAAAAAHGGKHRHHATFPAWTGVLRLFLLELPMGLLLATLLAVYAIRNIYQDLYVPLMDRATRTDQDLDREFTYYHRYCTEADLTTRNIHDLVADTKAPVAQGVEQMMQHGAVVIRDLLTPDTVRQLRDYVVYKNTHIPDEEVYPVSQGRNRMSFGYDATEHPIVVQALQELANHKYLKGLLSDVLGDADPASSEITTITAYFDAPPQAWHSDTKEDGNALKFGRTYSHSYSLFLPLQNTVS